MPAEIITTSFCAQYISVWRVHSASGRGTYHVIINGAESTPSCTCPAWKFSKEPLTERTCKHIDAVWKHACMWNPQWRTDPNECPNDYAEHSIELIAAYAHPIPGETCPRCGGPVMPVRIAV